MILQFSLTALLTAQAPFDWAAFLPPLCIMLVRPRNT